MCIPTYTYRNKEIINNIFEVEIKIELLRPLYSIQYVRNIFVKPFCK